jgi:hypothetical protein
MGNLTKLDYFFGFLYATAAILFFIVSYKLYLKRFKIAKLQAVHDIVLTTSRYDIYTAKTQFLIEVPKDSMIVVNLLNEKEELVKQLLNKELKAGETVFDFDPVDFEDGVYFLSLKSENSSILRRIKINK